MKNEIIHKLFWNNTGISVRITREDFRKLTKEFSNYKVCDITIDVEQEK